MATNITISAGRTSSNLTIGTNAVANVYGSASSFSVQTLGTMIVYSGGWASNTRLANCRAILSSSNR